MRNEILIRMYEVKEEMEEVPGYEPQINSIDIKEDNDVLLQLLPLVKLENKAEMLQIKEEIEEINDDPTNEHVKHVNHAGKGKLETGPNMQLISFLKNEPQVSYSNTYIQNESIEAWIEDNNSRLIRGKEMQSEISASRSENGLIENDNAVVMNSNSSHSCETITETCVSQHLTDMFDHTYAKSQMNIHSGDRQDSFNGCTGQRRISCNICSKYFSSKGYLKIHIRSHTDERPFSCNICSKCFRTEGVLREHMSIHTGECRFSCNICSKPFRKYFSLIEHMSIHTGKRPFLCNICKKSFRTKDIFTGHMIVHTDERPFSCNICSKTFRRKRDLMQHMSVHTHERPFSCNICSKSFRRKSLLKNHLKDH